MKSGISISKERIASFCQEHYIRRLAIFGSALRPDFRPDSDIDVLIEFEPEHTPGLFGIARLERSYRRCSGGERLTSARRKI